MDLTQINLHVLNVLIEAGKSINLESIKFYNDYFSLYRNYFESKATSTSNI